MSDHDNFAADKSNYERPALKIRCGRNALWRRPCWQGPNASGACGGQVDCTPIQRGDRYHCSRPLRAGGVCEAGPLPNGKCVIQRPACVPIATIRHLRNQISLIVGIFVIAALCIFSLPGAVGNFGTALIDPGELSSIHTGYTQVEGCGACHSGHDNSGFSWVAAAFLKNEMSENCLKCHTLNEPQLGPHNFPFRHEFSTQTASCIDCHKEHKGKMANLTNVAQGTCGNCHQNEFTSFVSQHPPFSDKFPSSVPNSIYFNHVRHINEYFSEPRWTKKKNRDADFARKAKSNCTTCHAVEAAAGNEIRPRAFEEICSGCHLHQIRDRDFIFAMPDTFTPFTGLLLGVTEDEEEEDEATELHTKFIESLAENADEIIINKLENMTAEQKFINLFEGLGPLLIRQAAQKWADGDDFELDMNSDLKRFGWLAGEDENGDQSLRYKPAAHADTVLRSWFDLLLPLRHIESIDGEELDTEIIERAIELLLDKQEGPGACAKCHVAGLTDQMETAQLHSPVWGYRGHVKRLFTKYTHGPHINLIEPDKDCGNCHHLDTQSDYAKYFDNVNRLPQDFVSNFSSISKDTCVECHRKGKVRDLCTTCHQYHVSPGNKRVFRVQDE